MQEQMLDIAGLEEFTDHDLTLGNDTPPDAIIVWFDVVKEYMPAASEAAGFRVYQNFVHRFFIKELGFSSGNRRIKDKVEYNVEQNCWKVKQLATAGQSDIKKWVTEWNRFQKGNNGVIDGTPIEMIFKHDPTRADMFCRNQVATIERLAGLTDGDCQRGGMGWRDDRDRAKAYLAKIKEASVGIQANAKIQQLESDLADSIRKTAELESKLTAVLTQQIQAAESAGLRAPKAEAPKKRERKSHPQAAQSNEGVE